MNSRHDPAAAHVPPRSPDTSSKPGARAGKYWLGRRPQACNWFISWFDPKARQTRRLSTGTSDEQEAMRTLAEFERWPRKSPTRAPRAEFVAGRVAPHERAAASDTPPPPVVPLELGEDIRAIPGYPGYYATSHGRIVGRKGELLRASWREPGGYLTVRVARGPSVAVSVGCTRPVHRLVLEAFVGPRPDGMEACHRNDHPWNNTLSNLRWSSPEDNRRDAKRNRARRKAAREAWAAQGAGSASEARV